MSTTKLTAIVCTHNRYEVLAECLNALLAQEVDAAQYEIIVVDNSPDANIAAQWQEKYLNYSLLRYIYEPTPGLSRARNIGFRLSNSDLVAYIDDDAIASPRWAANFIQSFDYFGSKTGVMGGKIVPRWPGVRPRWLDDRMLPCLAIIDWGGQLRIAENGEWFAGANIVFRKDLIVLLGGFPEALGRTGNILMSNEEIGLINSIRKTDNYLVYVPDAYVTHVIDEKRLNHAWFRERYAWQAVSDFFMDPQNMRVYGGKASKDVQHFLEKIPLDQRNVSGLMTNFNDPDLTFSQLEATYSMTASLLNGSKTATFAEVTS